MKLYRHQEDALGRAREGNCLIGRKDMEHSTETKLYRHQRDAVEFAKQRNCALFHECGCGKTLTALKIIEHFKSIGSGPALVVCPLSIIEPAWIADCRRFIPDLAIVSLWSKNRAERYRQLARQADIYVANFETFKSMYSDLQERAFDVLIVDESSKIKSPASQTTKAALAMAGVKSGRGGGKYPVGRVIPHRYVLSGTPAPNDRSEYWPQMTFIAPGEVFSRNYYVFRSRYFAPRPLGRTGVTLWDFTKDHGLQGEFSAAMGPWCHAVSKMDAVDLPEQVHEIRKVQLSVNERKSYETLRRELVLKFAEEEVLASSALVEIMKARQLTGGFCYGTAGAHRTGDSKIRELTNLLQEIGNRQVIIWCSFRDERERIQRAVKGAVTVTCGSDTEAIEDFKEGRARHLIANPQSAGHGLTFTNCSHAVYFSLTYSYELLKQSQDRIHRIGQRSRCTYYYLLASDTIDEVVYRTLANKHELATEILHYLRNPKH